MPNMAPNESHSIATSSVQARKHGSMLETTGTAECGPEVRLFAQSGVAVASGVAASGVMAQIEQKKIAGKRRPAEDEESEAQDRFSPT